MRYGIDYGLGKTNIDTDTNIRYGVIHQHQLRGEALEDFEPVYGEPACPECGGSVVDYDAEAHETYKSIHTLYEGVCEKACETCSVFLEESECYPEEPLGYVLDDGDYKAELHSDGDIFVTRSPYYTRAEFCSPCAPGACYLTSPTDKGGPMAYCLGHDFFESGKAPYPIFEVGTGKLVKPKTARK